VREIVSEILRERQIHYGCVRVKEKERGRKRVIVPRKSGIENLERTINSL